MLGDPVNLIDPNGLNWLDDFADLYKDKDDINKTIDNTKGYGHKGEDQVKDWTKKYREDNSVTNKCKPYDDNKLPCPYRDNDKKEKCKVDR